jgi:hypothetical protein
MRRPGISSVLSFRRRPSVESEPLNLRDEVQQVYLLVLKRLRERLERPEPLTGAELQAALRFCSDNRINVTTAQRAAPSTWDLPPLPFPSQGPRPTEPAEVRDIINTSTALPFEESDDS